MQHFTFENAGYSFGRNELSQNEIAQSIAIASPKYHELKADDPVRLDVHKGIVMAVAEKQAGKIEAYMILNKESNSYLPVEKAVWDKFKGSKYQRTVGFIVATINNPTEYRTEKDEAKKKSYQEVRESVRLGANTIHARLMSKVKAIVEPKQTNGVSNAVSYDNFISDTLLKIKARRKTSEQRGDVVPPEALVNEWLKDFDSKVKQWYKDNK